MAKRWVKYLQPACERIEIAGSVRRRKPEVGDVEILYVPRLAIQNVPGDMFACHELCLTDELLTLAIAEGTLRRRTNSRGSEVWGKKNKLGIDDYTGMAIDFFSTTADCFANYLVSRTGPAELNVEICERAQFKGWKWHPYGKGFECVNLGTQFGAWHVCNSEADVFQFVGLPVMTPEQRSEFKP